MLSRGQGDRAFLFSASNCFTGIRHHGYVVDFEFSGRVVSMDAKVVDAFQRRINPSAPDFDRRWRQRAQGGLREVDIRVHAFEVWRKSVLYSL